MLKLFTIFLLLVQFAFSQQRFIVSPNSDAIPLKKGENPTDIINKLNKTTLNKLGTCPDYFTFGYPTTKFPPAINHVMAHKDVLGQWFEAKASGTIDTIFWWGSSGNSAKDSLVLLRIFESNVGKDWGPGIPPYPAPCQSWGYWYNTNDLDQGVAAFIDDATDTTWISTIKSNQNGRMVPKTRPPFSKEKWGFGGYGKIHRQGLNFVAPKAETNIPLNITVGEKFFIAFIINSLNQHVIDDPNLSNWTGFLAWDGGLTTTNDENWPPRNWKFYEHDSGPGNCAGQKREEIKKGWVARGNFLSDDTLATAAVNIWYSITATTNVPPMIEPTEDGDVYTTFSTGPQTITYDIWDCDPPNPGDAQVARAFIRYRVATTEAVTPTTPVWGPEIEVEMTEQITDVWVGTIPGLPVGKSVAYTVYAVDTKGLSSRGVPQSYKVVSLKNPYYWVDTTATFTHKNIANTGTAIDTGAFFNASGNGYPKDDGTAGPFDLGGPFVFFGDTVRYVWVGVNGAIALSKKATDTIDVNSNGYATTGWDFPGLQRHYRKDTVNPTRIPPNFIAPFWADWIYGDTGTGAPRWGKIRYQQGYEGDPNQFIVQWDTIGAFFSTGPMEDIATFRVILNRGDGSIEFQYKHPGTQGMDSSALVGMQADSTELSGPVPGFVYVNRNIYPYATKPRANWSVKFYPGSRVWVNQGWQLLSVANDRGSDLGKSSVYPFASGDAFKYTGSYVPTATLENGQGFWLKFPSKVYAGGPGKPKTSLTIPVSAGWNMIGSITNPVARGSIEQTPGGIVPELNNYFYYDDGYKQTTILKPGYGHWIKTTGAGTLGLTSSGSLPKEAAGIDFSQVNKVTIQDRAGRYQELYIGEDELVLGYTGEMPPQSPSGFDARYKSNGGMAVGYPSKLDAKARYEYPISVTTNAYPITVKWEINKPAEMQMQLVKNGQLLGVMEGSGSVRIKDAAGLAITFGGDANAPKAFGLSQNYPNPFNPTTRFTVDVPKLSTVEVVVYDVLGRKVKTLMNGEMAIGSYPLEWDGTDGQSLAVPTGIYFIRLTADEFSSVQKIMLMK